MKLSKKILTFVAPIATIACVAPIITSCNNETFTYSYGDSINCLSKEALPNVTLHTLKKVQQVTKLDAPKFGGRTATSTDLTTWATNYKQVYYDLVASLANTEGKNFAITWSYNTSENKFSLTIKEQDKEDLVITDAVYADTISYDNAPEGSDKNGICILIKNNDNSRVIKSFAFINVTKE